MLRTCFEKVGYLIENRPAYKPHVHVLRLYYASFQFTCRTFEKEIIQMSLQPIRSLLHFAYNLTKGDCVIL